MATNTPPEFVRNHRLITVRNIVFLVVIALIPRIGTIVGTVAPARDSFRFIDAAQAYERLPFLEATRSINVHPIYPNYLLLWRDIVSFATGIEGSFAWLYAGQVSSTVAYCVFLIAAYAAGCRLWNPTIAVWGCIAISLVPRQVSYASDVLSDSLHAALWMISFAFLCHGWSKRSLLLTAMGGLFAALAFWTRVEALLLIAVFCSGAFFTQCWAPWRKPWAKWAAICAAFLVPALAVAGTYMWMIGNISARGTAMVVVGVHQNTAPVITEVEPSTEATPLDGPPVPTAEQNVPEPLSNQTEVKPTRESEVAETTPASINLAPRPYTHMEGYERAPVWLACLQLLREVGQETRTWMLVFGLLALFSSRRPRTEMPTGLFVFFAVVGCGMMLVLLRVRAGYIAGRYMTPILPLLSMYCLLGVPVAIRLIGKMPRLPWERDWSVEQFAFRRKAVAFASIAVLAGFLCVPPLFTPLHRHRYGHMQAAQWLREHSSPKATIFDPSRASSFFADRQRWVPGATVETLQADYAVVDPAMLYRTDPLTHQTFVQASQQGQLVAQFPRRPGSERVGVYVFDLQPHRITQNREPNVQ